MKLKPSLFGICLFISHFANVSLTLPSHLHPRKSPYGTIFWGGGMTMSACVLFYSVFCCCSGPHCSGTFTIAAAVAYAKRNNTKYMYTVWRGTILERKNKTTRFQTETPNEKSSVFVLPLSFHSSCSPDAMSGRKLRKSKAFKACNAKTVSKSFAIESRCVCVCCRCVAIYIVLYKTVSSWVRYLFFPNHLESTVTGLVCPWVCSC